MYNELVNSLRLCGKTRSVDDYCLTFHDGCCEAEPLCMYELMMKAADAIEELQQIAEHYRGCMNEWFETAQEYKAAYCEEHDKRIAENRYLYDELTKVVKEKILITPMRIEVQQPPKEKT